jgi:hypothetical protein
MKVCVDANGILLLWLCGKGCDKHPMLLPIGETAEFRIHKDKLPSREWSRMTKCESSVVVSMAPRTNVEQRQSRIGTRCSLAISWLPTWVRFALGLGNWAIPAAGPARPYHRP